MRRHKPGAVMPQERVFSFRATDRLASQLEDMAAAQGVSPSALLRSIAEASAAIDDEDGALLERLGERDPSAVADLLALNVVSLVHRACLPDLTAWNLLVAYAGNAPADQREALIVALLAAVNGLINSAPSIDDMEAVAEHLPRQFARVRAAA